MIHRLLDFDKYVGTFQLNRDKRLFLFQMKNLFFFFILPLTIRKAGNRKYIIVLLVFCIYENLGTKQIKHPSKCGNILKILNVQNAH